MSIRTQQASSSIRSAVQTAISRGLHDPRIRGLITVTRVDVAPDLSEAYVHVSILPEEHSRLTVAGLQHAAKRIRGEVRESVRMRKIPRLVFRLDESLKKQARLDAAIRSGLPDEEKPLPMDQGNTDEAPRGVRDCDPSRSPGSAHSEDEAT